MTELDQILAPLRRRQLVARYPERRTLPGSGTDGIEVWIRRTRDSEAEAYFGCAAEGRTAEQNLIRAIETHGP